MKRKRSQELSAASQQKKPAKQTSLGISNKTCHLTHILAQYGVLESITSHLFPTDLLSLALSSKAAYNAILPNGRSRTNLLSKMACNGCGIVIRNQHHQKSAFFHQYNCTEYATCGTNDRDRKVESRPCVSCGVTTCDECRIHCVYQSIYQAPSEADELPDFSGFTLLGFPEMRILSPAHVGINHFQPWSRGPYHDQGYLDMPLESNVYAPVETVKDILDFNLGNGPLQLSHSSASPHPSPVIGVFWDITEERKRTYCSDCFGRECADDRYHKCHCTLKSRFLDRWLCLPCYLAENCTIRDYPRGVKHHCSCGKCFHNLDTRILCLWCRGEVANPSLDLDEGD